MSRKEKTIFTNMCMVYDDNGNVLVQNRLNPDWPGITFPGGHVDAGADDEDQHGDAPHNTVHGTVDGHNFVH